MLKRFRTFLGISLLLAGGCVNMEKGISPFPVAPNLKPYGENEPTIIYNGDKTYTVQDKLLENSALEHQYLGLIEEWKTQNNIN